MFDGEQFISENETETLIRENEKKWEVWEEENKRLLILGLGSWYYKDNFLQKKVLEIHGEETKDMPLWQNNTIKYYDRIFLRIYKDHKKKLNAIIRVIVRFQIMFNTAGMVFLGLIWFVSLTMCSF